MPDSQPPGLWFLLHGGHHGHFVSLCRQDLCHSSDCADAEEKRVLLLVLGNLGCPGLLDSEGRKEGIQSEDLTFFPELHSPLAVSLVLSEDSSVLQLLYLSSPRGPLPPAHLPVSMGGLRQLGK